MDGVAFQCVTLKAFSVEADDVRIECLESLGSRTRSAAVELKFLD
jgi:hypothetical protein